MSENMKLRILIVTSENDKTSDYFYERYGSSHFFRLNLDEFSEYEVSSGVNGFDIYRDGDSISSNSCRSIYFRKPTLEKLNDVITPRYHAYVHKETYSLIEGIIECFGGVCLSKPSILRNANNKIIQAIRASKIGFNIPPLAITNSQKQLERFKKVGSIVKPVAIGSLTIDSEKEYVQTNILDPKIDTEALRYSPVYLQEYIDKDYEVRVTVIGATFFPVRIDSEDKVDWRNIGNPVDYSVCSIPDDIKGRCLEFMSECNIAFGCFDFIIEGGIWHFLEMNANGQWLWLEIKLGLSMSDEIMRHLGADI